MKILLHACCAPCAIIPAEELGVDNDLTLYWYNPNIHPAMEYLQRREALDMLAEKRGLPVIDERVYDMARFIERVAEDPYGLQKTGAYEIYPRQKHSGAGYKTRKGRPARCAVCYRIRLDRTAKTAVENGFDAFTTTLFYSPYQDRDKILKAGREAGEAAGVMFAEYDWTGRYREGQDLARETGLYRQKYCGCIYSEKERYGKRLKKYVDQP